MATNLPMRKARPAAGQTQNRIIAVVAGFCVLLACGWLIGRGMPRTYAMQTTERPVGTLQTARDKMGRCENFEVDNRTVALRSRGYQPCSEIVAATSRPNPRAGEFDTPPEAGTMEIPTGRVNSISGYFKTR